MNKNFIYTNSSILINKINLLINNAKIKSKKNICEICNKNFKNEYICKNSLSENIIILESSIHMLNSHNIINIYLYKSILCEFKITNENIEWSLLNSNGLNILDGLYEEGSNKIYLEKNKNIFNSKIIRFSEYSGLIYFKNNQIDNITILNKFRVEQSDPLIYMPSNSLEALKVDYIFHTHPKTPYIGSRVKSGIIYEFPSISDIIHYIEHHNNGKLLGSIVITPEGIYIIRKYTFDRNKIKIDYDILIDKLEDVFMECYNDSYSKYSTLEFSKLTINNEVKIPEDYFYNNIAVNFEYIEKINNVLINYDIFIDYYPRVFLKKTLKWIFPDIYIPFI